MKNSLLITIALSCLLLCANSFVSWGQGYENFTNLPTNSSGTYLSRSWTGSDGVTWTAEGARTDQTLDGKAICFGTSGTRKVTSPTYSNGMGTLQFDYVRGFTNTKTRTLKVYVNSTLIQTVTVNTSSDTPQSFSYDVDMSGNVVLEIHSTGLGQVIVDNISWTSFAVTPTLTRTPTSLSGFTYVFGNGPSTSQSFSISGSNLTPATGNITVTAPTNYEVSLNNSTFSNSVNVAYTGGAFSATTIYARLKAGLAVNSYNSENITISGGGATPVTVTCNGSVADVSVTLDNTGTPAASNRNQGSSDVPIFGFRLTPNASIDFTQVSITTSGTATNNDFTNFRLVYDANSNGVADASEISSSLATVASLANPLVFTGFTQTFSTARRYLVVADVPSYPTSTPGKTLTLSVAAAAVITTGSETGTANGNTQTVACAGAPAVQASNITFSAITANTATISWTNGNGEGRVVKINTTNSFTTPTNGSNPMANTVYGGGEQVVFNGTGNTVNITGLSPNTTYYARVYEYRCTASRTYLGSTATSNPDSFVTNVAPVTSPAVINPCISDVTVQWSLPVNYEADKQEIVVFAKQGSAVTVGTPTITVSSYTADNDFSGSGTAYENDAAAKCVFKGDANNVNVIGLSTGITYHFLILAVRDTNIAGSEMYSAAATTNGATITTPGNITFGTTTAANKQLTLNWTNTNTCFDEVLIVGKQGSAVTFDAPTGDGTDYTANGVFATTGTDANLVPDEFAVFKGNGTSAVVTGLTNNVTYHFRAFTRKDNVWSVATFPVTSGVPIPINTLGGTDPSAASYKQGFTNNVLYRVDITPSSATTLNSAAFVTAGTYIATDDVNNFKLWYSTDPTFNAASDTLLGTLSSGINSGSTITFSSLARSIPEEGGFLFVTVDLKPAALLGRTVKINTPTLANFDFASGTKVGTFDDGNFHSIIQVINLTLSGDDPNPTQNFTLGSFNNPFYRIELTPNTSLTLNEVKIKIDSLSTLASSEALGYKLFYSADNTFDANDVQIGTTQTAAPNETMTFSGLVQEIVGTKYLFVTVDITTNLSAADDSIAGKVVTEADITFNTSVDNYTTDLQSGTFHRIVSPSAQWANTSATRTEGSGGGTNSFNIPLQLIGNVPTSPAFLKIHVGGTATYTADFTFGTIPVAQGSVSYAADTLTYTFPSSALSTPTIINIPLLVERDGIEETDETIIFTLVRATGTPLTAINQGQKVYTFTIEDDDVPPTVNFFTNSKFIGERVDTIYTVTMNFSTAVPVAGTLTMKYNSLSTGGNNPVLYGGTGLNDYVISNFRANGNPTIGSTPTAGSNGTFTIDVPAGATEITFDVAVRDDAVTETDQRLQFTIHHSLLPFTVLRGTDSTHTLNIVEGTLLEPGDFAIVAINGNRGTCTNAPNAIAVDQISFVCFKDIVPGTTIDMTDNGWERTKANKWGTTEGVVRITRTTSTLKAGTVVTFTNDNATLAFQSPDNNWTKVNLVSGLNNFAINNGGDQLYFMQGGEWNNDSDGDGNSGAAAHDGFYSGRVLYGFSTSGDWEHFGNSTQRSGLYPGLECFSSKPTAATDFNKYKGDTTITTKRGWIVRLIDSNNWRNYSSCNDYDNNNPDGYDYAAGITFRIASGDFEEGIWEGKTAVTNWFDCSCWQSLSVPTKESNVVIAASKPSYPIISSGTAEARQITIENTGSLTINGTGNLDVYGSLINKGTFTNTTGTGKVTIRGTNPATVADSSVAANLGIRNLEVNNSSQVSFGSNITIASNLNLVNGTTRLNGNRLTLNSATFTATGGTITGNTSGSAISYTGTGSTNLYGTSIDSLTIDRASSTITLQGDLTVRGNSGLGNALILQNGDLALNSHRLTIQNGRITGTSNGRISSNTYTAEIEVNGDSTAGILYFHPTNNRVGTLTVSRNDTGVVTLGSSLMVNDINLNEGTLELGAATTLTLRRAITTASSASLKGNATANLIIDQVNTSTAPANIPNIENGLNNLTMNRVTGASIGGDTIPVRGVLAFKNTSPVAGSINTGNTVIDLGTTGTLTGEGSNRYVVGKVRALRTVNNNSNSFGGIGVTIDATSTSQNLGQVAVLRTAGPNTFVTVNQTFPFPITYTSINRRWLIEPQNQPSANVNLTLQWLSDDDNGKVITSSRAYRRPTSGAEWIAVDIAKNASGFPRSLTIATDAFSEWTVSDNINPLPITLLEFTGYRLDLEKVQLTWTTASELNNAGFEVQMSENGKDFRKVEFVKGAGNSNSVISYQLPITNSKAAYYRLKQIDFDGKFTYSQSIFIDGTKDKSKISLFPNPTNETITLRGVEGVAQLQVVDALGRVLLDTQAEQLVLQHSVNQLLEKQPKGTYLLRFVQHQEVTLFKLIKQ